MKTVQQENLKKVLFTVLRMSIGWHFLYEGLSKVFSGNWSSYNFLMDTHGFFSPFYHWLVSSPSLVKMVDMFNMYGLVLIGLALFVGILVRYASYAGAALMVLYYFAYPPFGFSFMGQAYGESLYIVNKVFIEGIVLLFFSFSKYSGFGLGELLIKLRERKERPQKEKELDMGRREVLKNLAFLPVLGLMGWGSFINKKSDVEVFSGATNIVNREGIDKLEGKLPKGKLGKHEISRLVAGGNLMGGWSHARDLRYASELFTAYNTEKKVFETLMLCEQAGVDSINIAFRYGGLMAKYKKLTGSKIKVITQVGLRKENGQRIMDSLYDEINKAIDNGSDILQVIGNDGDLLTHINRLDMIEKMLSKIRAQGYTAGLGAHEDESLIVCEKNGIIPDYYMKTMHHDRYWSAHPLEKRYPYEVILSKNSIDHNQFRDNMFCLFPEKTVAFVNSTKVPVMGFKVLAAGAIAPEDGFNWAFQNGADFICVGMFDFQVVKDVNICIKTLKNLQGREREWYS